MFHEGPLAAVHLQPPHRFMRKSIPQGGAERLAQDLAFRLIGSESAFQDPPKRGDEPTRKNALEQLSWRQSGVYS
jgi:hypothetical protein